MKAADHITLPALSVKNAVLFPGLSGLVMPVGAIKEKVLAAHRAGIHRVILPRENEKDLGELPEHVRRDMVFVFAERIRDVLAAAIPELGERPHPTPPPRAGP